MNDYQIRYNRTTTHIDGLTVRTQGSELNYSQNVCGALTRGGMAVGKSFNTPAEALRAAKASNRKVCKNCQAAAEAMIEAEKVAEVPAETIEWAWTRETAPALRDQWGNLAIASW